MNPAGAVAKRTLSHAIWQVKGRINQRRYLPVRCGRAWRASIASKTFGGTPAGTTAACVAARRIHLKHAFAKLTNKTAQAFWM